MRMHRSRRAAILYVATFALTVALSGCSNIPENVKPLAASADELDERVEEFGTASMSSPILTMPTSTFNFSLSGINSTTFYNDAKANFQSQVADFSQVAKIAGLQAQLSLTPVPAAQKPSSPTTTINASSGTNPNNSVTASITTPSNSGNAGSGSGSPGANSGSTGTASGPASTTGTGTPTTDASDAAALNNGLFQSLLAGRGSSTLSDRDALFQAAGDTATLAMFQVLGDQSLITKFADKKILLGVVTVAVNPGSKTRRGYAADISTQAQYDFTLARLSVVQNFTQDVNVDIGIRKRVAMTYGLPLPSGYGDPFDPRRPIPPEYQVPSNDSTVAAAPTVAAVAPMTQSTINQDLNSRRQQTQLALDLTAALSKAGLTAQANFFDHFAKSLQQDADSIDLNTTVNTYTLDGGLFGFEIGPRLRAIENRRKLESEPGDVLDRQSFPALVIFGFDADDIRPRVKLDEYGQMHVYEPKLRLTTITSWKPTGADFSLPGLMVGHPRHDSVYKRLSEYERFVQARQFVMETGKADDDANDSQAVDQYLDELAIKHSAAVPGQPPHRSQLEQAPLFSTGQGNFPPAVPPRLALDTKSQLMRLDNSLNHAIRQLRDDASERPVYHQLTDYERTVSNRIALIGLPEQSRDTAVRYILDAAATQIMNLQASAAKLVQQSPPASLPSDSTNKKPSRHHRQTASKQNQSSAADSDQTPANQHEINDRKILLDETCDALRGSLWELANAIRQTEDQAEPTAVSTEEFDTAISNFRALIQQVIALSNEVNKFVPPPKHPNSAPTAPKIDKSPDVKAITTALLSTGDEIRAADELCKTAFAAEQVRDRMDERLDEGAASVQEALFPHQFDREHHFSLSVLDPGYFAPRPPAGERPDGDNTAQYALDYTKELISKVYGSVYDAPLPAATIEPVSQPQITNIFTDFIPTADKPRPLPTDVITATIIGSALNAIDVSVPPKPLTINPPGTTGTPTFVTVQGVTAGTTNTLTVHLTISANYRYPLALQFTLLNGSGTLNSPPFLIPMSGLDESQKQLIIRRITGPETDPTQQMRDELQIINAPRHSITSDLIKSKIEQDKPETRHRVDVNVDLNPPHIEPMRP